ncbi:carboxypeptidase N subunit 2-like isoform X2 [Zootermopsis nevadensis]|uniref:carboxypeptidase N subunit 2-like isoform X2 n=1 Tax=Zootermopsis nevadensis TaxID=136037 RepID=UPI000B8EC51B|nr:carboxypeptidase N subunit 2-like isoform X2 [Zootermopsis nevadensis]
MLDYSRMEVLILLTLATSLLATAPLDPTPQLCLSDASGGLACRCTDSRTELDEHLWEVDCSCRNLTALPSEWQILPDARRLDLSRNQLSLLRDEQFSRWGNLEELSLARNKFTSLNEAAFSRLANLRMLDLSYNMLQTLPVKIFEGISVLSTLNLEMNRLQELPPYLFSSTSHLNSLILSYNTALGKYLMKSTEFLTIVLQRNISSLALNNMSIERIPNGLFNEASQLHHLSLADNPLRVIDVLPASLESLNLSGIDVEVLVSGDFISYPKLKKLQLDRLIHLRNVQENAFEGLASLEELTMENCIQLHSFDERAFGGPDSVPIPLKRLSLARSGLHTLSNKTFLLLQPTLKHVALQGNSWRCDCNLAWIHQTNFSLENTAYLRCFSPDEHHNRLIPSLDLKDFVCTHESAKQNTYSGLIVVMDMFLILVVVIVACAILMTLWRRGFMLCTPRQTVGRYSHVTIDPSRAELEWDDKDLDHIWSTPNANRQNVPRGP